MQDFLDVLKFHQKFDLPQDDKPVAMDEERRKFRAGFLFEEAGEYDEAWRQGNLVKAADALLDYVYVVLGTALFIGCPRAYSWPRFFDSWQGAVAVGVVPAQGAPLLLRSELHEFAMEALKAQTKLFLMAHDAGEMNLALNQLRRCATTAYGVAAMMLLPWEKCWRHVQDANMAKKRAEKDGSDSKRSTPWDVVKPAGWKAPDAKIAMELQLAGWKVPEMMLIDNATGKVEIPQGSTSNYAGLDRKE